MDNLQSNKSQKSQIDHNSKGVAELEKVTFCPFLNIKEAALFVRLNKRTLENMRSYGNGPVFRKHGNRVYYHIDDLNDWSSERSQTNI